jgi:hypothetical protein
VNRRVALRWTVATSDWSPKGTKLPEPEATAGIAGRAAGGRPIPVAQLAGSVGRTPRQRSDGVSVCGASRARFPAGARAR